METLIKSAKIKIENENRSFGFEDSQLNVSAQIWSQFLNSEQRFEIMQKAGDNFSSQISKLRECHRIIKSIAYA